MFISFEGIDGSGKSTQAKLLVEYLSKQGIKCIYTKEPGGTPIGDKLRNIILYDKIETLTEMFLIFAARNEHIKKIILPALQSKICVICDRFIDSTLCYQGILKNVGVETICQLHQKFADNLLPDATFLLDLSVETSKARLSLRPEINAYDNMSLPNRQIIREGFLQIAEKYSDRIRIINAEQNPLLVHKKIINDNIFSCFPSVNP